MTGGTLSHLYVESAYSEIGFPVGIIFTDSKGITRLLVEREGKDDSYCVITKQLSKTQFVYCSLEATLPWFAAGPNFSIPSAYSCGGIKNSKPGIYDISEEKAYELEANYWVKDDSIYTWSEIRGEDKEFDSENFKFYKIDLKTYEIEDYTQCIPLEILGDDRIWPDLFMAPDGKNAIITYSFNIEENDGQRPTGGKYIFDTCIDVYELNADEKLKKPITHNVLVREALLFNLAGYPSPKSIVLYSAGTFGDDLVPFGKAVRIEF